MLRTVKQKPTFTNFAHHTCKTLKKTAQETFVTHGIVWHFSPKSPLYFLNGRYPFKASFCAVRFFWEILSQDLVCLFQGGALFYMFHLICSGCLPNPCWTQNILSHCARSLPPPRCSTVKLPKGFPGTWSMLDHGWQCWTYSSWCLLTIGRKDGWSDCAFPGSAWCLCGRCTATMCDTHWVPCSASTTCTPLEPSLPAFGSQYFLAFWCSGSESQVSLEPGGSCWKLGLIWYWYQIDLNENWVSI